ncbi:glycosyltransferase family 50 protein [Baudoinia panamericana UAMH 10762]|uniref:GPI mannosyltransferase 1 n=1 Tax=Baudoinia panamericana (strain UAMH 10762) TaxID=717646 RepID=M2N6C9_BAUPA|nr:glycosyltransferase family 50 protein [Baudoinia panamericana UAMH 10762]EMC94335.1 glycosyltransferase family 50 protein [Baudoinia panamericana UAMH 10762]
MRPAIAFTAAILLRLGLIHFGYTDIDYLVFTDAARFVSKGRSPYDRATYRYTPLLAWILWPTTSHGIWFEYGKALFAAADVVTGWLMVQILRRRMALGRSTDYACIWLLNPIVASISARGSSEGLVALLVVSLLWATLEKRPILAGLLLGLAVHFKIYPFIYGSSILLWLERDTTSAALDPSSSLGARLYRRATSAVWQPARVKLVVASAISFLLLNSIMLYHYGMPFVDHTFLHHITRIDHRHNFSVYNTILHMSSAYPASGFIMQIESIAFIPQLLLSVVLVPFASARRNLAGSMLAQTFAFVTFNKVCTSQYFLWYMVFLPLYLPDTTLLWGRRGLVMIALWVLGQAVWLQQGYELEFLGRSTFVPGLWLGSIAFFLINCWILRIIVEDVGFCGIGTTSKKQN